MHRGAPDAELGLQGVRRGKRFVSTRPEPRAARPGDHVQRQFAADRSYQLWLVDFTYVPTWSGMAFTAFVTDVFSRRVGGWRTADRTTTELPLDALEMALWVRDRAGRIPLEAEQQLPSDRLPPAPAVGTPPVDGTRGDSVP